MPTKYPIILVHGIMIKDFKRFRAFGKIESLIKSLGYTVYSSNHDGFGKIETNAAQIRRFIERVLRDTGAEKVNIIAHSKGGLDSLYMIDRLLMAKKVASVTFLSTPHKGSAIATKLYSLPRPVRSFIAFWINFWYKIFGDTHPDALGVCKELMRTPDNIVECFDHHDGIFMQSYSTTLERSRDDFVMGIPLIFSRRWEMDSSDGLVSLESSKYREYRGHCTDGSVSHSEIIDFMVKKKKKEKIYAFYISLLEDLSKRGY